LMSKIVVQTSITRIERRAILSSLRNPIESERDSGVKPNTIPG
jgi:hypothetical protein